MNKNKMQVMCCGACAVRMDESGQVTTSIDMLVEGVRKLFMSLSHNHGVGVAHGIEL